MEGEGKKMKGREEIRMKVVVAILAGAMLIAGSIVYAANRSSAPPEVDRSPLFIPVPPAQGREPVGPQLEFGQTCDQWWEAHGGPTYSGPHPAGC